MESIFSPASKEEPIRHIKLCTQCRRRLPLDQFYDDPRGKYAHCIECHKWYVNRWMKKNPDKVKAIKKRAYEKRKAINKPVSPHTDCFRVKPERTLDTLRQAAQEPTAHSQIADAQDRVSKSMPRDASAVWWPYA